MFARLGFRTLIYDINKMQAEIALAAAQAGKHLLTEKPLADNSGQARAIAEAVAQAGVVAAVDFEFRAAPGSR